MIVQPFKRFAMFLWQCRGCRHHRCHGQWRRTWVTGFSQRLRNVQTGLVSNYALTIALGMVVIVGVYLVAFSSLECRSCGRREEKAWTFQLLSAIAYLPSIGASAHLLRARATSARTAARWCAAGRIADRRCVAARSCCRSHDRFRPERRVPVSRSKFEWLSGRRRVLSPGRGRHGVAADRADDAALDHRDHLVVGHVNTRPREYYIALLLLETGMLGVFMALDLFVFYIFWEVMLIPMALLIGVWGSRTASTRRSSSSSTPWPARC